jgi:DNA adenine methylase
MSRHPKIHQPLAGNFQSILESIADEQKPEIESAGARPFLKWVGGKRSIVPEILRRMPEHYGTYREPFIGGGIVFFSVQPASAYLADINFHLIQTYQAVRDDVDRLILNLKLHEKNHNLAYFQKARMRLSTEKDSTKIAALFIYLNKTCFNGLYRVNKAGKFNVPIGSYKDLSIFNEAEIRNASSALKGIQLYQHPFFHTPIVREDFYYLDPPYHQTYSLYDGSGFADEEHRKLAAFCRELDEAGAYFMLSNSDTPFIRELYNGFWIDQVAASRTVSCKGNLRGKENELIIRNYPR